MIQKIILLVALLFAKENFIFHHKHILCTHMNLDNIPNLEGFLSDPESIVLRV